MGKLKHPGKFIVLVVVLSVALLASNTIALNTDTNDTAQEPEENAVDDVLGEEFAGDDDGFVSVEVADKGALTMEEVEEIVQYIIEKHKDFLTHKDFFIDRDFSEEEIVKYNLRLNIENWVRNFAEIHINVMKEHNNHDVDKDELIEFLEFVIEETKKLSGWSA